MEANTVVLPLEKYHELLAYKEAMELEKSILIYNGHCSYIKVVSSDEAVQLIGEKNSELKSEMHGLNKKARETLDESHKLRSTLSDEAYKIRKMSLIQLIKWYFNGKKL